VGKRVDADRPEAVEIKLLGIFRRRFQDHLVLIIMLGSVRIFSVAAVRRPSGGLHISGIPWLGTKSAEEGVRGKSAGADLQVIGLHDKTPLL